LPSTPTTITFGIGAGLVRDPDVLAKMILLRRHLSRLSLVPLSDRDDIDDIAAAMEQGVRGYIPTSLEPSEAAAALRCVMAGGTFVPVSAMIKLVQDRSRSRPASEPGTNPIGQLTPRESEVLACVRLGKPNKIIAHETCDQREHRQGLRSADHDEAPYDKSHRARGSETWSGRFRRSLVTSRRGAAP
jgi:FixJ family two-component response regulator